MKKVSVKIVLFAIGAAICLILACFGASYGQNSYADYTAEQYDAPAARASEEDDDHHFKSVDVRVEVSESKILTVTEKMVAVWDVDGRHSLIRDIQRVTTTTRVINGKEIKGKAFYTSISVISATLDGKECDWKILPWTDDFYNSEYHSIEMKQANGAALEKDKEYTFVLKYDYDMSADRVKGYDDLVLDVLGYGMARTEKFTATVVFPDKAKFKDVSVRTSITDEIERGDGWDFNGNEITISVIPVYPVNDEEFGYTVQVLLEGKFFNGHVYVIWYYFLFAVLFALAVAGLIVLFVKNMPKKPAVETVEFYPPDGVDIMQFSAVWHRKARNKDAAALILKWAEQGLITIEKDGNYHFILRAQKNNSSGKDKNGKPYCETAGERAYYNALFSNMAGGYNKFSTRAFKKASRSEKESLYYATKHLKEWTGGIGEVVKPTKKVKYALPFVSLIPSIILVIYICFLNRSALMLFFVVFMVAGTFVTCFANSPEGIPLLYIFPVSFYGLPYCAAVWSGVPVCDYAYLTYTAPAIYALGNFVLPFLVGRRTDEAQAIYGRLRGFKRFLLTAELSRISLLFDENPEYFADVLPYCLIMGISKKVQKRFAALKNINVPIYVTQSVNMRSMSRTVSHIGNVGRPHSSGGGGGGSHGSHASGGGHGGSHGGGGGGGGSRSR